MNTKRLITCNTSVEATLIKGRLSSYGIESFLTNENFSNLMPIYNNMLGGGIQILVSEEDYEKATKLIDDKINPQNQEKSCSFCDSKKVKIKTKNNKNILIALLSFLIGSPFGNIQPQYYCANCGEELS